MKNFSGKILFLDRSDINTDEIIPAKYLTESTKEALIPYCLEDLSLPGFDPKKDIAGKSVIVTRANFGCGSSREHAPWVLEYNNINLVIAVNFARIFRQNMFNCGLMAISLPEETIDEIFKTFGGTEAECTTDMEKFTFTITNGKTTKVYPFKVGDFDLELVKAGGWVDYADSKY
ncbi:MAG: 3-isopropylmalate dehydratase small subunit [Lentisphaeria bacterium]|nr:3-isopropylmalate dehydratase small subunit [Lentisphaeria bacterium]